MVSLQDKVFVVLWSLFLGGFGTEAYYDNKFDYRFYDYSASIQCLARPLDPQYDGGLLVNPAFNEGLKGWNKFENTSLEVRNIDGNPFSVTSRRTQARHSASQLIMLEKGLYYAFSAWVQISEGSEIVLAAFSNPGNDTIVVGTVIAKSGCWSMIKGGFTPDFDTEAHLQFQTDNTEVELWIDSVSLQTFTKPQWRLQQHENINKTRMRNLRILVSAEDGTRLRGMNVTLKQTKSQFLIGCATTKHIITNKAYQDWFASRFSNAVTTFENEMKWYTTEVIRGFENYTIPDGMVAFAKQHGVLIRGHAVVWDNPDRNVRWVKALTGQELLNVTRRRFNSVMTRYRDDVIGWDVVNENMHFDFFEENIGPDASSMFYKEAQALDPNKTMFLNEFNTLEEPTDIRVTPTNFLAKIQKIRSFPGNGDIDLGIGLQSHFRKPDIPYIRACLDILAETKLPLWITELDVMEQANQTLFLEEVMREVFSYPAVDGIVLWSAWNPEGCYRMCLTDNNFKNLPAGDVIDKLLKEWTGQTLTGLTNENGVYQGQVYHGEYFVTVLDPCTGNTSSRYVNVTDETTKSRNVWIAI